jgi:integrase
MQINQNRARRSALSIRVADLVDHYVQTELSDDANWHSHATRVVYEQFLKRWIRPQWADVSIRDVRTVAVEQWLRRLQRLDGDPLANATKAKIRNLMSVLFNHAIRYEWLEQGRNPITLVRQSAKRTRNPEVLELREIQNLLFQLNSCFRVMVILAVTTGLRRSELFALKWCDVDFSSLRLEILRSICLGHLGNCKTQASRNPVPLDLRVAADLWLWREATPYRQADDWIFASPRTRGRHPFWPDAVLQKVIRPAALRAGIKKRVGWHTFRHTFSTLLVANGENVKVVQELMRHASSRCTLEVYSQAKLNAKREAQKRLVEMILPDEENAFIPPILGSSHPKMQ